MSASSDSRQYPRRPFAERIFCYVDGERLDACTRDLSAGGLFFEAGRARDVPTGAVVAVVLKDRVEELGTLFLFGRVVRHGATDTSGLAVRWEKAVGPIDKERMATALREVFRIRAFGIEEGSVPSTGQVISVFRFVPEVLDDGAGDGTPRVENPVGPELFGGLRPDWKTHQGNGPVTQEIDVTRVGIQTNVKAVLAFDGASVQGRVSWLSTTRLRFVTRMVPADETLLLAISFDIPTRTGAVTVTCHGRVASVEREEGESASSLVIDVERIDERGQPGVLRRYVRWLHAREIGSA
jgi:hypothetical protein